MVLQNAYKTLMDIGGLETEAEYGYDGEDEACKFNRSKVSFFIFLFLQDQPIQSLLFPSFRLVGIFSLYRNFNRSKVAVRVSGGVEISEDEEEMAKWLLKNGPISIALNAFAMQFYMGGVSLLRLLLHFSGG